MTIKSIHTFLLFLSLNLFLFPPKIQAQHARAFSPRELKPFGQMRDEIYENTATFRLIRTQEERRPRDARALGPQDLGPPGIARPELINTIRRGRKKGYGGGWFYVSDIVPGVTADANEGYLPNSTYDKTDTTYVRRELEIDTTEWWEQKFRGQGQRGGWFRARFGSAGTGVGTGTSTAPRRSGGGSTSQTQQQSSGAVGESMLGGMGVGR
jgi:hypothetical protein